ncbi:glycosyltransferase family A protein, partial [Sphingobacterium faecium]|uniref:glycosyltransferase family A protein n=1 Tax=Sphingobacterium faecium TaxID=34087 RepID=UPI001D171964
SIEDIFNLMIRKKCALSVCISKVSNITKLSKINIIISLRNISVYVKELCDSILCQRYKIYHVYFLDDNSDDNFTNLIPDILSYTVIKSTVQRFALENIIDALLSLSFDNDDIIMLLDGDDILAHEYVFEIINEAYNVKTTMATHGSFAIYHTKQPFFYSYTREQFNKLRKVGWNLSPLRTFKFGLFSTYLNLDPTLSHMKDHYGSFYRTTYDMALFFPLLEICGYDRLQFIEDVLYYYRIHETNDFIINRRSQFANELEIRKKQLL